MGMIEGALQGFRAIKTTDFFLGFGASSFGFGAQVCKGLVQDAQSRHEDEVSTTRSRTTQRALGFRFRIHQGSGMTVMFPRIGAPKDLEANGDSHGVLRIPFVRKHSRMVLRN